MIRLQLHDSHESPSDGAFRKPSSCHVTSFFYRNLQHPRLPRHPWLLQAWFKGYGTYINDVWFFGVILTPLMSDFYLLTSNFLWSFYVSNLWQEGFWKKKSFLRKLSIIENLPNQVIDLMITVHNFGAP